jgi:hypothetical protein
MNAPPLEPDLLRVVERYRTCEFATISRTGVPVAWPTSPVRRDDGTFLISTSIGMPQKALNVRRDPKVALLFSDPTGSGVDGAPELLVQGTAVCPDEIKTSPAGAEDLWRQLYEYQPAGKSHDANVLMRWFMDWYFMRLYITVTPTAISTRSPLVPLSRSAELIGIAAELNPFPTAVLGVRDEDGTPRLLRVNFRPGDGTSVVVDVPKDAGVRPGPASLLAHAHDEKLWNMRFAVLLGELSSAGDTWTFNPSRTARGITQSSADQFRWIMGARKTAKRYLGRRGLARPRIDWAGYAAMKGS